MQNERENNYGISLVRVFGLEIWFLSSRFQTQDLSSFELRYTTNRILISLEYRFRLVSFQASLKNQLSTGLTEYNIQIR